MKLRTVFIDDEDLAIDLLHHFIHKYADFEVIKSFTSPKSALDFLMEEQPDVVFLDIQMAELNGLNLIKALSYKPIIVLVTAYSEFAQQAFDLDVVDYLLKPYTEERFEKSIEKILQFARYKSVELPPKEAVIYVKHNGLLQAIPIHELLFVEGLKQYVRIVTPTAKYITLRSLKELETELITYNFKRIHKSFLVNFNQPISIKGNTIQLFNHKLPIGRSYKKNTAISNN